MKFTILSTFLVVFSGLVASAPTTEPQDDSSLLAARQQTRPDGRIYPIYIDVINEHNPDIPYFDNYGVVSMSGGKRINSILTFKNRQPGKTCKLSFQGQEGNTGAATVSIRSVGAISRDQPTWNNRPTPGHEFGTFVVNSAGDKVATDWKPGNPTFTCPEELVVNFELSAAGSEDMTLAWDPKSGLYLVVE